MILRLFLLLLLPLFLHAKSVSYGPFIDEQIKLTLKLNDPNIDEKTMEQIIEKKERLFERKLEEVLANKSLYLHYQDPYASKIYKLQKIIAVNKRRGNTYAVIRDQVLIDSYRILQSQNKMLKEILQALDLKTFDAFATVVSQAFVRNQQEISHYTKEDYKKYLQTPGNASVILDMKQRILEHYAIIEINADLLKTIADNERKMYRLNKYYKYGLIKVVMFVNHTALSDSLQPLLSKVNLSLMKLLLILFVIIMMFLLKIIALKIVSKVLNNFHFKSRVITSIIRELTPPMEILALLMGLNLIIYIYNDFSRTVILSTLFEMSYTVLLMWMLYKVLNIIAASKISSLAKKHTSLKSELVNISVKITNFMLILITLLIVLHQAGVNLTAILSGLGIGGFAIALAAKDSLANFFGTLSILMSDTFSQGDWIVVDDQEGVVVEIGLRVTTIRTFDNALISIPNSKLANEAIKNWSKRKVGRRIKFRVGVRYDSDKESLQKALLQIEALLASHPGIAKEENSSSIFGHPMDMTKLVSKNDALGIKNFQLVTIDELADSSIDILVYCFTTTIEWAEWAKIKDEIIFGVMQILESNGLEFAFPSMSLYHEDELRIKIDSNAANKAIPAK